MFGRTDKNRDLEICRPHCCNSQHIPNVILSGVCITTNNIKPTASYSMEIHTKLREPTVCSRLQLLCLAPR